MLLDKLSQGVLRVLTPLGPRYVNPSFLQRLYLLWVFRNFDTLPVKVLSRHQQRRIEALCARHGFISMMELASSGEIPVLGTLEQRPALDAEGRPPRRPSQSVSDTVTPFAADVRRGS